MTWIIIIVVVVLFVLWGQNEVKKVTKIEEIFVDSLQKKGIDISSKIILGKYIGGHPEIDSTLQNVFSFKHRNRLTLYAKLYKIPGDIGTVYFKHITDISIDNIKGINIEDATSIDKKVTLGRVLLVGVFALAWKRQKKNEAAFLNIIWVDGKYEHETLFQFENKGSLQEANKVRNSLIKQIR